MNSNRYSKLATLLVVLTVALAAIAVPAAAATVEADDVPDEAQVGDEVTVTYTLTDLYEGDTPSEWTLRGETNMTDVSWSVAAYRVDGDQVGETDDYAGGSFEHAVSSDEDVAELEVTITGTVPEIEAYSYEPREEFLVTSFTEVRDSGATSAVDSWSAHHYTDETRDAREKIEDAEAAVEDARDSGADVSDAENALENAKSFYDNGDFDSASDNAADAGSAAEDAQESAETRSLLLYGGVGLVLVLVLAGIGYVVYQRQGDDYDKLG